MPKTNRNSVTTSPGSLFIASGAPGFDLLSQEAFRRAIYLEQKRTERSRRKFALMLASCSEPATARRHQILTQILNALAGATRETDIVGWYDESATLGIIFTEIGESDAEPQKVQQSISSRITGLFRGALESEQFKQLQISFHVFPDDWDEGGSGHSAKAAFYESSGHDTNASSSLIIKRAMDIFGSGIGIALLSPIMIAIAIAIKLTSNGTVLFRQQRVGRYGKRFTFLKFRSMRCANDSAVHQEYMKRFISGKASTDGQGGKQAPVFKITNDPRVTPIGRFLRRTSLDELPQFFNVFIGEMSLVGPRPPIPYEVECYDIWHRRRLLAVKPGITGLWQVSGRSKVAFDDMVRLDLKYARSWSIWLDIKILVKTPRAVLGGEGAF
jgi:lipopolysaccharide/colanic/teichoic acid biosynthesis glycosyltransferase